MFQCIFGIVTLSVHATRAWHGCCVSVTGARCVQHLDRPTEPIDSHVANVCFGD
jgi:hypothetical protein